MKRLQWLVSIDKPIVVCTSNIKRLQITTYLHYSPGLLFLYVNLLSLALKLKHKDEDLTKQLQLYAESLTKIQEDLHLEQHLKTITEELERMRAGYV